MSSNSGPRISETRKINTDTIRIMLELGELVREAGDDLAMPRPPLMERIANRVREERFTERALIVNFLLLRLPDAAGTRDALALVFGGEHRRLAAVEPGSDAEAAT